MQNTRIQSLVQELRSHMPLGNEARAPQQKIPHATTKTQHSQIKKKKKLSMQWPVNEQSSN